MLNLVGKNKFGGQKTCIVVFMNHDCLEFILLTNKVGADEIPIRT